MLVIAGRNYVMTIVKNATWQGITPRIWQPEAFEVSKKHYNSKKPVYALIEAIMAAGKSDFIVELAKSIILKDDEMVVITTPTTLSIKALKKTFKNRGVDIGVVYNREYKIRPITIVCDRSVHKMVGFNIKFLIPDEAHGTECETYLNFVKKVKPPFLFGITGTPYKSGKNEILSLFKKVLYTYQADRALTDKVIVPWNVTNYDKSMKKKGTQEESCVYMAKKFKGKGIINASSIKDAVMFNELLYQHGVKADVIHCEQTTSEQKQIMDDFIYGGTKALVYADMLYQSINLPFLRWGIFRRKVSSKGRFVQEVGRLIRTDIGKEYCEIYDPHDLFNQFNITNDAAINTGVFKDFSGRGNIGGFGFHHLTYTYETKLKVENAIRNVSIMLRAYGLKMTLDRGEVMKRSCSVSMHMEFKELCKGRKPKTWQHLLTEIDKKYMLLKRGYGLEIIKILKKIKILEFWPTIDKNNIIKLTEAQREKITIINIMRFKPFFWKGRYYSKTELCKMFNMSKDTFDDRRKKWDLEKVLLTPLRNRQTEGIEGYVGKTYGALTVLKVNIVKKMKQNTSFICRCKCGDVFSRTYNTILKNKTNKKCICRKPSKRYKGNMLEIKKEADLVGKTFKGYYFTSKEKRTTTPGKYEWNFYGHCIECGKPIKISKYNLKNRHNECQHQKGGREWE